MPIETTGRFKTRKELNAFVLERRLTYGSTYKHIARAAGISVETVGRIARGYR